MNLDDLESVITKFWEGIFRKGKRPIQPVEMARALVREMIAQRRVSVSRVYVPNIFEVSLSENDFQTSAPLHGALCEELAVYVKNKAREKEYTLIGRPTINFIEDGSLELGDTTIKSSFSGELPLDEQSEYRSEPSDNTMIFGKKETQGVAAGRNYRIAIVSGPDQGKSIFVQSNEAYYIGRKSTNHLALTDINASREHVKLEKNGDLLQLIDLGSKNGTFVDGIRIEHYDLNTGDEFMIGENLFRVEGS